MMKTMLIAALVALEADFTGGWRRAQEIAKLTLPWAAGPWELKIPTPIA
jgi:hypothetical protein